MPSKVAASVNFTPPPPSTNPYKAGVKAFKKVTTFLVDQAGDGGTVNTVAKFARRVFEFLAAFGPIAAAFGPAGLFFKNFTEVFKVLSIFKDGQELINADKIRKLASAALGFTTSCLMIAKIIDAFGWIKLAAINASFGRVAVIGAVAIVPLAVFISWLEGLKAGIEISLSVSALLRIAKKVSHVNEKKRFWETPIDKDKCKLKVHQYSIAGKELEASIDALEQKRDELKAKVEEWADKQAALDAVIAQKKAKLKTQNKVKRAYAKVMDLVRKIRPPKVTRTLRKWEKLSDQVATKLDDTEKAIDKAALKKVTWQRMGQRYDKHISPENEARYKEDRDTIEEMRKAKFAQVKAKKFNLRLEQFKEGASILMNGGVIILTAGSTALFFVGVFATPAGGMIIPILLPALGLTVATFGLGMHFFKRWKGKKTPKVELPTLSSAKTWKNKKKASSSSSAKSAAQSASDDLASSIKASEQSRYKKQKLMGKQTQPSLSSAA